MNNQEFKPEINIVNTKIVDMKEITNCNKTRIQTTFDVCDADLAHAITHGLPFSIPVSVITTGRIWECCNERPRK